MYVCMDGWWKNIDFESAFFLTNSFYKNIHLEHFFTLRVLPPTRRPGGELLCMYGCMDGWMNTSIHTNNSQFGLVGTLRDQLTMYVKPYLHDIYNGFRTKHTYIHFKIGHFLPYIHFRNHGKYHAN